MFLLIISTSCDGKLENEVTIIVPNGTPFMAVAGLLEEENVNIEVVSGPANLQTALVSGSHDIVIAPINLGANLYSKGNSKYQVSHILTLNNAYIVTRSENKLDSINDLKNQTVLAFGSTGIPGSLLKKIYNNNSMDLSLIDFQFSSSSDVYSVFAGGNTESKYALMSEPEISKLVLKDGVSVKTLDLCKELGFNVAQACIYVNPESKQSNDVEKVLEMIKSNIEFLNNNPESYANKIISLDRRFSSIGSDVIARCIPLTNIVFKEAKTNKEDITNILTILNVGLPADEFYK